MKPKEWIERLQSLDPNKSICIHLWQMDDVIEKSEDMSEDITNEEAQEILEEIEDNIDSEMGVSWTTLRVNIEDLIKK